jgi:hypothetical protein
MASADLAGPDLPDLPPDLAAKLASMAPDELAGLLAQLGIAPNGPPAEVRMVDAGGCWRRRNGRRGRRSSGRATSYPLQHRGTRPAGADGCR